MSGKPVSCCIEIDMLSYSQHPVYGEEKLLKRFHLWLILVTLSVLLIVGACTRSSYKSADPGVLSTPTFPYPDISDLVSPTPLMFSQTGVVIKNPTQGLGMATLSGTSFPVNTPEPSATPEPTEIIVPTATPGLPETYALHQGEHVFCLARRFNLNPVDLLSANGLTGKEYLNPGYVLKIPTAGSSWSVGERALKPHPAQYSVMAGDTIYSVACQYGDVDPNAIIFANQLTEPYGLAAGQVLRIP